MLGWIPVAKSSYCHKQSAAASDFRASHEGPIQTCKDPQTTGFTLLDRCLSYLYGCTHMLRASTICARATKGGDRSKFQRAVIAVLAEDA